MKQKLIDALAVAEKYRGNLTQSKKIAKTGDVLFVLR